MTYPRAHLVDAENGGIYHCISRCVRRAWLCGEDSVTGQSFGHRRQWVEDRILALSRIFAVRLYGYAIMSNHHHIILETRPHDVRRWSDEDVVERWLRVITWKNDKARALRKAALVEDPEQVARLRARLGNLSWFMAKLNEHIARRTNAEDDCKGRFWEGRFTSIPLLDDTALIAAMVYVDLNPVRAGMTRLPERAQYTSVARRSRAQVRNEAPLEPLKNIGFDLPGYIELLHWTATTHTGQRPQDMAHHRAVNRNHNEWTTLVEANGHHFRAYGPVERIRQFARRLGQRWIGGYRLRTMALT